MTLRMYPRALLANCKYFVDPVLKDRRDVI